MARSLTASDRTSLIRLASSLPVGSPERKAILEGLSASSEKKASGADPHLTEGTLIRLLEPTTLYYLNDALGNAFRKEHKKYNLSARAGDILYYIKYANRYKTMIVIPQWKLTNDGKPRGGANAAIFALLDNPRFEVVG